jgi:hypothetical protein
MTPEQIQKFYAVPVLANVPVVTQYGEGDFSYQGLRGLGQAVDAAAVAAANRKKTPMIVGTGAVLGAVFLGRKGSRVMGGVVGAVLGLMVTPLLLDNPGPLPSQPVTP